MKKTNRYLLLRPNWHRCQWSLIILLLVAIHSVGQTRKKVSENAQIKLEQLRIDESENVIKIGFSTLDSAIINRVVSGQARLQLNIQNGKEFFNDVAIKKEERHSANTMQLMVQPPFSDAIYRTEKRVFTLQIITDSVVFEKNRAAILGTATKAFDLRPYAQINQPSLFIAGIIGVAITTLLLLVITPLYRRFRFKKNHIKKYSSIKVEGKQHQDPFTFVIIDDDDEVVVYGDQVMLLSSWKTLKKLPNSKLALEHEMFFEESLAGSLFYPDTYGLKQLNQAWFGMIGILAGWILYLVVMSLELGYYHNLLSQIFDYDDRLVSTVIAREAILGLALGIGSGVAIATSHQLYTKGQSTFQRVAMSTILKISLIWVAFVLQALATTYLIQNFYLASFFAWLLIGIAFALPTDFRTKWRARILEGMISGTLAFGVFQVLTSRYFLNLVYTDFALLCGLVITGLSTTLINVKTVEGIGLNPFNNLRNWVGALSTFKLSDVKSRVRASFLMAGKSKGIDQESNQSM